ncbi:MAG: flagellin lysine-N-methylase [Clostridia bacterium]|nr:flagellin lysine-N-methylase [Clostridia bacterium]
MIYIMPSFYKKFKCIADKCTDNCCIGWEIDVDDDAFLKYERLNTPLGEEIRKKITVSSDGSRCFELSENDRCPFLNEQKLCRIIIECGADALCEICKNHPRFYEWFPGVTECGLGLSCEEVCRILLSDEKHFYLDEFNDRKGINLETKEDVAESDIYIFLAAYREILFKKIFSKEMTFKEKIDDVLKTTENFLKEKIEDRSLENIAEDYKKTEPIDESWTLFINSLSDNLQDVLKAEDEFNKETKGDILYSKIFAYIIYRHFIKAVFDMSIKERVRFAVESVRFIYLCDMYTYYRKGELTLNDRIENLKNWSKQIEYSDENTDYLIYGE